MKADWSWSLSPGPLALIAIAAYFYARAWRRARREGGPRAASGWRAASFAAGLATFLIALVSPVDRLAEQLASMHMVQHMLLVDIASILVILGLTKVLLRPATRRLHRIERAAGPFAHPAFALVLYVAMLWLWHAPPLYDLALRHPVAHALEHLLFSAAGILYWWHLLSPVRARLRFSGLGPVAYMASTKILVGFLGIALTFYPDALYDYVNRPRVWGLSAVDDQAIAGLIMAIEQSLVMGVALVVLLFRGLAESERQAQRAERFGLT